MTPGSPAIGTAPGTGARATLVAIRAYQKVLSPGLSTLTALAGPACACRFTPTCSVYTGEAIRTHGLGRGLALGAWRLLRCNPWGGGGEDPVPARRPHRPACTAAAAHAPASPFTTLPPSFS